MRGWNQASVVKLTRTRRYHSFARRCVQSAAIDDAEQFPTIIVASTDCRLAHAEDCRNYWQMDDDDDWDFESPPSEDGAETE